NHQGDVQHGLAIVEAVGKLAKKHAVRGALKFQFRQLDTFIHPVHHTDSDHRQVTRFQSTRLSRDDFRRLLDQVRSNGLISMCTPFDEESVDLIEIMGIELIKIASCSARDWPLLERVAASDKPVIFSTGGLDLAHIDDLVSFFDHRGVEYAIMHCVALYPTPDEMCQLNQLDKLRSRYPGRVIGWSTHEDPDNVVPVQVAVGKGAEIFERHVGIETESVKLNAYSSTPEQLDAWLTAYHKARAVCGSPERPPVSDAERDSIDSLRRGVYARERLPAGSTVRRNQIYFAMPYVDGQLSSGEWKDRIVIKHDVEPDHPLQTQHLSIPRSSDADIIKSSLHDVKALLNEARVPLNSSFQVEYSHHYGIANFRETGAVIIDCVNRQYCKKIVVQLPEQRHPAHFHKLKEETFQVLFGELNVVVEGHHYVLHPGESCLVQPGAWHHFWTETGVVFEEISSTHHNDDSFYKDKSINRMKRSERKTQVDHWGRFQLYEDNRQNGLEVVI
ncbi:MAG: D-lyxose/D-mannose family sugar isomerase, partial [Haliea sp.]